MFISSGARVLMLVRIYTYTVNKILLERFPK